MEQKESNPKDSLKINKRVSPGQVGNSQWAKQEGKEVLEFPSTLSLDRSQSLFDFVPQEFHSQAGSTTESPKTSSCQYIF